MGYHRTYRKAKLKTGDIVVTGCSTSEIIGSKIGTNSSPDTSMMVFEAIYEVTQEKSVYLAAQCCEHLNRAIIVKRQVVPFCQNGERDPATLGRWLLCNTGISAFQGSCCG